MNISNRPKLLITCMQAKHLSLTPKGAKRSDDSFNYQYQNVWEPC